MSCTQEIFLSPPPPPPSGCTVALTSHPFRGCLGINPSPSESESFPFLPPSRSRAQPPPRSPFCLPPPPRIRTSALVQKEGKNTRIQSCKRT
ncbi:MAG: hypothetical protein ACK55Z_26715 [bacterium]